jgi:hypothetical protein
MTHGSAQLVHVAREHSGTQCTDVEFNRTDGIADDQERDQTRGSVHRAQLTVRAGTDI